MEHENHSGNNRKGNNKEFTMGMMHDMGKMMGGEMLTKVNNKNRKMYPSLHIDDKLMPEMMKMKMGEALTLHAHAKIMGMNKHNDEPASYDLEIEKMGMKPGHNPYKSKSQARKFFAMAGRGEMSMVKAREWAHETPDMKRLPERVKSRKKKKINAFMRGYTKGKK